MNVFFDVQGTLLSGATPRPHAREIFQKLEALGHHVYLWSSAGAAYAYRSAFLIDVYDLAYGYHGKSDTIPVTIDYVVDDDPGIVKRYGGYEINLFTGDPDDNELWQIVEELNP